LYSLQKIARPAMKMKVIAAAAKAAKQKKQKLANTLQGRARCACVYGEGG
jgi:hypothetical protein